MIDIIEKNNQELNSKIVGGWLVAIGFTGAWQIETRTHFDVYIEAYGLHSMFDQVVADIRPTEREAWELAHDKLQKQMIDSMMRFVESKKFIESKIKSLVVDTQQNHN